MNEQQVRNIVRDEIIKVFSLNNDSDLEWLNAKKTAEKLGYDSVRSLYNLKDNGVLRLGKEYHDRRTPGSTKGDYYFNFKACEKRLNTPPEKRA